MDVFISWSGNTSLEIAKELYEWLPVVFDNIKPWMSKDIAKGRRWGPEIDSELEKAQYGLICLTPDNLEAPWILYEAGALAKSLTKSYVVPLLFQVSVGDLPEPLARFQAVRLQNGEDVKDFLESLSKAMVDKSSSKGYLEYNILERRFDALWPQLQEHLNRIAAIYEESKRARETSPVELADLLGISTKTASRLEDLFTTVNDLTNNTSKYLMPWEQQDPRQLAQRLEQLPEAVYFYNASRFGVGHVNASFMCEIRDDGSAKVWREIEVEAFSRISSLDAHLVSPPEQSREASLAIGELTLMGPKSENLKISLSPVQKPHSRNQNVVNLMFTPPLRPGQKVSYKLAETGTSVFLLTTPSPNSSAEGYITEFFGWSIERPTKRLVLSVTFPAGYEPSVFFPEVTRSSSSGFSDVTIQIQESETIRVNRPGLSGPDEQNRQTLSMVVDYPMTGLVYTMRWIPIETQDKT